MKDKQAPSGISLKSLASVKTKNNDDDGDDAILTSCDTHGTNYKNVKMELDFASSKTNGSGSLVMCRGVNGCETGNTQKSYSGTDHNGNAVSCSYGEGQWSRCHKFKFPGQTANTKAEMTGSQKIKLTFEGLPENKRYDLYVASLSTDGTLSPSTHVAKFYIDAKRPEAHDAQIPDTDVGKPNDGSGGRNYTAHSSNRVAWQKPSKALSSNKWLQCNTNDVAFTSKVKDQFDHNLKACEQSASRKNGSGTADRSSDLKSKLTGTSHDKCNGTLGSIDHGRQTIQLFPKDSCETGSISSSPAPPNITAFAWDVVLADHQMENVTVKVNVDNVKEVGVEALWEALHVAIQEEIVLVLIPRSYVHILGHVMG